MLNTIKHSATFDHKQRNEKLNGFKRFNTAFLLISRCKDYHVGSCICTLVPRLHAGLLSPAYSIHS